MHVVYINSGICIYTYIGNASHSFYRDGGCFLMKSYVMDKMFDGLPP